METQIPVYREQLQAEFESRRKRNSRYSIRAFARHVGVDAATLSQIMRGKRFLSVEMAEQLFHALKWNEKSRRQFLCSLAKTRVSRGLRRKNRAFSEFLKIGGEASARHRLSEDQFAIISEWFYYAILELTEVEGHSISPASIVQALGIHPIEAARAIERLKRLGLLHDPDGRLVKSRQWVSTANKARTSTALRQRQRQILEKSISSLERDPIAIRNHSSVTFAINPKRIAEARARIEKFFHEMEELLAQGGRKKVYEMSIQLFPLQR